MNTLSIFTISWFLVTFCVPFLILLNIGYGEIFFPKLMICCHRIIFIRDLLGKENNYVNSFECIIKPTSIWPGALVRDSKLPLSMYGFCLFIFHYHISRITWIAIVYATTYLQRSVSPIALFYKHKNACNQVVAIKHIKLYMSYNRSACLIFMST